MVSRGSTFFSLNLYKLAIAGGVVFWAATIAISLLPIAREYRAHYTNWNIQTVWFASLPMGLIIGCCVGYALLRRMETSPARNAPWDAAILGMIALVVATVLFDVPRCLFDPGDALPYFLIGILLNAPRFLLSGIVIGYLYKLLYGWV